MNCHHVFPDLARLEETYRQELVVIGVHSGKFDHEQGTEHIRNAARRFGLHHPIVNDARRAIWERYGARSWPTFVVIDPEGFAVGTVSGEGQYDLLDATIRETVELHDDRGTLDRTPIDFGADPPASSPLRYPAKVFATADPARLLIADTNHHRIVIATLEGRVQHVVGDGTPGHVDGPAPKARFRHPHGLWADAATCWVADTENHRIRAIDLRSLQVTTAAGTGAQVHRAGGGAAATTPLNSPWDVTFDAARGVVFIAMAGQHQIWALDPARAVVVPFAGSRAERLVDGTLGDAGFNQPCGLALVDDVLYVADCEASALRAIDLRARRVQTLVGTGLFDWGDVDAVGPDARLQHPGQVAWDAARRRLCLVDSYNHKLKSFDPATGAVRTLAGDGTAGRRDAPPRFSEPGGCAVVGDRCFVADTNNHAVRVVDLTSGAVTTLTLTGLASPK